MQNIRFMKVTKGDLIWLFHTSQQVIDKWTKAGLKVDVEGKYLLSDAIAYLKNQHRIELQNKLLAASLSQQDLTMLFGISRQSITEWGRSGIPRRTDMSYDLRAVCHWLVNRYPGIYEKKYNRRLVTLDRKLTRNYKQCLRFLTANK
jgi:hypothetical protein